MIYTNYWFLFSKLKTALLSLAYENHPIVHCQAIMEVKTARRLFSLLFLIKILSFILSKFFFGLLWHHLSKIAQAAAFILYSLTDLQPLPYAEKLLFPQPLLPFYEHVNLMGAEPGLPVLYMPQWFQLQQPA